MNKENHIEPYNAADISRYLQGKMTPAEMHALEKAALDDPFLADAIDGYANKVPADYLNQLTELKQKVNEKANQPPKAVSIKTHKQKRWMYAAASLLLGFVGFGIIRLMIDTNKENTSEMAVSATNKQSAPIGTLSDSSTFKSTITNDTQTANEQFLNTGVDANSIYKNKYYYTTTDSLAKNEKQLYTNGDLSNLKKTDDKDSLNLVSNNNTDIAKAEEIKSLIDQDDKSILKNKEDESLNIVSNSNLNNINTKKEVDKNISSNYRKVYDSLNTRRSYNVLGNVGENKPSNYNTFNGRIVDRNNKPLPFVNIMANNSQVGTYSDANGAFNLISTDSILPVTIKSIGYSDANIVLNNRFKTPENKIVLDQQPMALSEVIVAAPVKSKQVQNLFVYDSVGVVEPKDGWDNYDVYIANNLRRPEELSLKNIHGEVQLIVTVDQNGKITAVDVEKSLNKEIDAEAIRLIKEGPAFKLNKGKKGKTTIKIRF